ncbi:hypothetical protein CLV63_12820 [Murinocardiopsis flavida]|uniref:Uncharacterized protein n=1 Tax=Murinocardiopsis flavida TaxID=645275 RepID=A0A2P8CVE8_9ACTN|nr:hypothetical protein CLV63_12820 [Murinocardiopsis flavida]
MTTTRSNGGRAPGLGGVEPGARWRTAAPTAAKGRAPAGVVPGFWGRFVCWAAFSPCRVQVVCGNKRQRRRAGSGPRRGRAGCAVENSGTNGGEGPGSGWIGSGVRGRGGGRTAQTVVGQGRGRWRDSRGRPRLPASPAAKSTATCADPHPRRVISGVCTFWSRGSRRRGAGSSPAPRSCPSCGRVIGRGRFRAPGLRRGVRFSRAGRARRVAGCPSRRHSGAVWVVPLSEFSRCETLGVVRCNARTADLPFCAGIRRAAAERPPPDTARWPIARLRPATGRRRPVARPGPCAPLTEATGTRPLAAVGAAVRHRAPIRYGRGPDPARRCCCF